MIKTLSGDMLLVFSKSSMPLISGILRSETIRSNFSLIMSSNASRLLSVSRTDIPSDSSMARTARQTLLSSSTTNALILFIYWQFYGESSAFIYLTCDLNVPAMLFYNIITHGKSESCPAGTFCCIEGIKYFIERFLRYAFTGVGYDDIKPRRCFSCQDFDAAGRFDRLGRVHQHIPENFFNLKSVSIQGRHVFAELKL